MLENSVDRMYASNPHRNSNSQDVSKRLFVGCWLFVIAVIVMQDSHYCEDDEENDALAEQFARISAVGGTRVLVQTSRPRAVFQLAAALPLQLQKHKWKVAVDVDVDDNLVVRLTATIGTDVDTSFIMPTFRSEAAYSLVRCFVSTPAPPPIPD